MDYFDEAAREYIDFLEKLCDNIRQGTVQQWMVNNFKVYQEELLLGNNDLKLTEQKRIPYKLLDAFTYVYLQLAQLDYINPHKPACYEN